ncbi:M15 family metallopeptidase [Streptomyces sp. NPDC050738]|uniref:M15 family metallopeptidase n=1 Tax=Streptomyces sp. NPDC050738 TaxID=3154744 RepID=UPI00343A06DF
MKLKGSGLRVWLLVALLATGCSAGGKAADPPPVPRASSSRTASATQHHTSQPTRTPTATRTPPSATPSPEMSASVPAPAVAAVVSQIGDRQWARIVAAGAWRPECPVGRAGLRRVELNHWGFDGAVHRGSLVVRDDVAASVVRVFTELFEKRFPIRRMEPIEAYGGDDAASMRADNSSAFNCRKQAQANASAAKSPHGNGRAVDINPMENPWTDQRCKCWQPSAKYSGRTPGLGKILKGGPVWRAFTAEGWIWQDISTADYQHFDTGFPSRPLG